MKKWYDEFQGKFFFSHSRTNSHGVAIGYFGSKPFAVINQMANQNGRTLVTEVKVNVEIYVLPNIYNPNIKSEQLPTISQSSRFLEYIHVINSKTQFLERF